MSKSKFTLTILSILLCLGACAPGHNDYSLFTNLSNEGWSYGDTISFIPDSAVLNAPGTLSVALRHDNSYRYSNLWLEITSTDNEVPRRDTVNIVMADKYGRWKGSGLGTAYQIEQSIPGKIMLKAGVPVKIRHVMRVDTLHGIELIGINYRSDND